MWFLSKTILFLIFFFLFFLFPASSHAETIIKGVTVIGNQAWSDTGINLVAGNSDVFIKFGTSPGRIYYTYYTTNPVSPEGLPGCIAGPTFVLPGATCYSLIARIDNGEAFQVQPIIPGFLESTANFKTSATGPLYFGFNDEVLHFSDNVGRWGFTVIVNNFPTPTPTPTPIPTPAPTKTPLILIPGIGGSELKAAADILWSSDNGHGGLFANTYKAGDVVWVNNGEAIKPGDDDYFDVLRMHPDGTLSQANLALTGNLYAGAYQEAINFFTSNGYTLNQNFFVFPYDWRKDLSLTKDLLDQKIGGIKTQTGSQKVDIVAHSMGGLVARNYIADLTRAQNVRKLFNLGTPHLGSVKFIKALRYGVCLTDPRLPEEPFCSGISPSEVKDVIQNMIGGYQLIPSQTYYNFYSGQDNQHPYPFADLADIDNNGVTGALNYAQLKTLFTNLGHNTSLFTPSEAFHNLDSQLTNTNGVEVTNIVGSGMATLGQIIERYKIDFAGIKIPEKDEFQINGDNTVPLLSASFGSSKVFYSNQKHGELPTAGPALNLVKNIINGDSTIPSGASTQPFAFNNTGVSVHSPVNIHVYDSLGRHTGPTAAGDFEVNIPGSSYDTLDDAKFIWLPNAGQYTIKFEATNQGSFDFKIRKFENDVNTSTVLYNDIPLSNATKAQASLNTSSAQPPSLQLDKDGNGTTDATVNPSIVLAGSASSDVTPPQSSIELAGTQGQNGWYKSDVTVILKGTDEQNGSGLDKIKYTFDNGQTIQIYNTPFTVSTEGIVKLKFRSIDKAGNEEIPREIEIKIDKNPPEAKVFIDQDKQDLIVEGIDDNPTTVTRADNTTTKKKDDGVYTITDAAGNTLKLDVRERDKEKQDRFRIYSLQYNNDPPIVLENNHFNVTYQGKKDKLNVKEQNFEIKGEIKIRIQYNAKKNQSTIILKIAQGEKVKDIIPGLLLLKLVTSNGQLEPQF